jgi:hypothetical protein
VKPYPYSIGPRAGKAGGDDLEVAIAISIGSAGAIFDSPGDLVAELLATTAVLVPLVFVVSRLWLCEVLDAWATAHNVARVATADDLVSHVY